MVGATLMDQLIIFWQQTKYDYQQKTMMSEHLVVNQ